MSDSKTTSATSSPNDQWTLDDASYNLENYYTKASDFRGHRESVNLKISPEMAQAASELVQSQRIPDYKTTGDIFRDGFVHRMHWLGERGILTSHMKSLLKFEMAAIRQLEEAERRASYESIMERLGKNLKELKSEGKEGAEEARRIIQEILALLADVEDRPYWKNKYLIALAKQLGDLSEYVQV